MMSTGGDVDPDRRVKELEADGTVGEIVLPPGGPFGRFALGELAGAGPRR